MFCSHCGGNIPDGAAFCCVCGSAVIPASQMPKKKKRLSPLVFILPGALLLVAIVTAVVLLLTAKQTVYLRTETTANYIKDDFSRTTFQDYDSQGRLTGRGFEMEIGSDSFRSEFTYRYNDDGQVETLHWSSDDSSMEIEYIYDQKGILEEIDLTKSEPHRSLEYDVDRDGRITEFMLYDDAGSLVEGYTYAYDDEGRLEERTLTSGDHYYIYCYDDAGRLIEQKIFFLGEEQQCFRYAYNEYGHQTASKIYYESELTQYSEVSYEYDRDGNLLSFEISTQDGDIEATLEEEDDSEIIFAFSGEDVPDDCYLELVYDRAGNLKKVNIYAEDALYQQYLYDYKAVEVPRSYEQPDLTDPIWIYM